MILQTCNIKQFEYINDFENKYTLKEPLFKKFKILTLNTTIKLEGNFLLALNHVSKCLSMGFQNLFDLEMKMGCSRANPDRGWGCGYNFLKNPWKF